MKYAYLLALVGAFLLGFSPILVRLSELGPVATAFYRVLFTIPCFGILLMENGRIGVSQGMMPAASRSILVVELFDGRLKDLGYFVLLGMFLCGNLICWHLSLIYTFVANATLLANLSALFVIPLGWLLLGLRVRRAFIFYALCSFVGIAMLMSANMQTGSFIKGDLLAMGGAFFYALYQLLIGHLRKKYTTMEQMLWTMVFSSLWILPCVWIFGESLRIVTLMGLIILLSLSLLCQFVAQGFISYSLGHITPNLVSLTLLIQPVMAACLGWLVFAEVLSLLQFSGIALTLFCLYMAKRVSAT